MTNIHLISDESIGGLLREYVETDRKADAGDYVLVFNTDICVIRERMEFSEDLYKLNRTCGKELRTWFSPEDLKTLAPTDIVVINEQRYRLVDRTAEVGEKVVVVANELLGECHLGKVYTVTEIDGSLVDTDGFYDDNSVLNMFTEDYRVLVPVEEAPKLAELLSQVTPDNRHAEAFVDESQASPDVIAMLANLAQRIVALEEQQRVTSGKVVELVMRYGDEIDVLHANQKRLAEEVANKTPFDADEVIVELAKLLVEAQRTKGVRL